MGGNQTKPEPVVTRGPMDQCQILASARCEPDVTQSECPSLPMKPLRGHPRVPPATLSSGVTRTPTPTTTTTPPRVLLTVSTPEPVKSVDLSGMY